MNSRLAARDVDGGAYCCTGKAHHLARRLRAEPEVGGVRLRAAAAKSRSRQPVSEGFHLLP